MTYQELIQRYSDRWTHYTQHSFVQRLIDGSLPQEDFKHYLLQNFVFLQEAARCISLLERNITCKKQLNILHQTKLSLIWKYRTTVITLQSKD